MIKVMVTRVVVVMEAAVKAKAVLAGEGSKRWKG